MSSRATYPYKYYPRRSHIYALNEVDIKAPPEVVWKLLIDAENYSSFYPHAKEVKIVSGEPVLALGTKYTWKTAELPLVNTEEEFLPYERLAWSTVHREVDGPTAYHGWVITPNGAGCHLLTEETQQGPFWLELARKSPGVLYQFHQDWVEMLGRAAEKEAAKVGR